MRAYTIHPLVVGINETDQGVMTYLREYGKRIYLPIYAFYLKGGDRNILVDTGLSEFVVPAGVEEQCGFVVMEFEAALATVGLTPEAIDLIIHTHLHNDHCENDYKCVNAEIYVHRNEVARIHDPHPLDYRYVADYIEEVEENGQLRIVEQDMQIAAGINVVHTPVHTDGGLSVFVDTNDGKACITGFCVIMENFNPPKEIKAMEMAVIPPGTHVNVYEAYDWMVRIRGMADILLPLHEPRFASVDTI